MTYGQQVLFLRVLAASALVLAGFTAAPAQGNAANVDPQLQPFYSQEISWEPCSGRSPRSRCATVTVPLDYRNPTGRTIDLALLKVPATGPNPQALLVNPGGPGAGGLDFAEYLSTVTGPNVRSMYDIVGFDPRGVGQSAPVRCLTGAQTTQWYRTDSTPDTAQERRTLLNRARAIARGCLNHDPELARNVGSTNTVKDMDVIRQTLAQDTLHWFGFSYGTGLGALYAQEFPSRVGRFVLDGGVDPRLNAMQLSKGQSDGFQLAVRRFAADCARRSECVASSQRGVLRNINRLLKNLDESPMRTDGPRRLVQAEALSALFFSMYSTQLWPTLRNGLRQATRGNGTTLQLLAQQSRNQIGPDRYGSNMASAFYAIACWDFPATPGIAGLSAAARSWSRGVAVPEMARAMSWGNVPCSNWFGHSPVPPQAVTSTTQASILIIGTQFDPATPYAWSQALKAQLPTSRLLTYRGDGHTAYGGANLCVDGITNRYLTTGELPEPGTTCSG